MCRTIRSVSVSHILFEQYTTVASLKWRRRRMLKLPPPSDLKVYGCLSLVTLLALIITLSKIKMVEMIAGPPDSSITFKPVRQRTGTNIKYTGNGFMPEDWQFFHSGVCSTQVCR